MCPLRFGDPCTLCMPYVNGPEDCQSVALVMSDPDLKAAWAKGFSAWKREQRRLKEATKSESTTHDVPEHCPPAAPAPLRQATPLDSGTPHYW